MRGGGANPSPFPCLLWLHPKRRLSALLVVHAGAKPDAQGERHLHKEAERGGKAKEEAWGRQDRGRQKHRLAGRGSEERQAKAGGRQNQIPIGPLGNSATRSCPE